MAKYLLSRDATPVPTLHYNPGGSRKHPVSKFDCEDVVDGVRTLIDRKYVTPGNHIPGTDRARNGYLRQLNALDQNLQAGHQIRIRYEISESGQDAQLIEKLKKWVIGSDWDDVKKDRIREYIAEGKVTALHVPAQ